MRPHTHGPEVAFGGTPNSRRKDTIAEERKEGAGQTWRDSILWSVGTTGEPERRQQESRKRPREPGVRNAPEQS